LRKPPAYAINQSLESLVADQKMVAPHQGDQDFVGYARYGELAGVQIFFVREGKLIAGNIFC